MTSLVATVGTALRGLRSRALLSLASLALIVVAIGGTVVGPMFQQASTISYTVSRLDDARAALGLLALFLALAVLMPLTPSLAGRLGIGV